MAVEPGAEGVVRVTVLVCTKDRQELLGPAVDSLVASMGDTDELLVVEAGSAAAHELAMRHPGRVRVVRAPVPGKSRQLNLGVRAAAGQVIVCTDDDCRVDADWVDRMVDPFADPAVGVVFGPVAGLTGVRGTTGPAALTPGPASDITWHYANGAAMAVRRRTLEDIGGYDERLGPGAPQHGEEHDVVLRAVEAGWSVWIADAPVVSHVEWRDDREHARNLRVYSRGAGAFLGAAVRRSRWRWLRLVVRRVRYQARQWRHWRTEGISYGPATSWAFLRGFVAGLRLAPGRWL